MSNILRNKNFQAWSTYLDLLEIMYLFCKYICIGVYIDLNIGAAGSVWIRKLIWIYSGIWISCPIHPFKYKTYSEEVDCNRLKAPSCIQQEVLKALTFAMLSVILYPIIVNGWMFLRVSFQKNFLENTQISHTSQHHKIFLEWFMSQDI